MTYSKITETPSNHDNLEQLDTTSILMKMNEEDQKVADAVQKVIPEITKLVDALAERFLEGGRLFYIGAGTSGRLGILDASEIPPTFGMPHERVVGLTERILRKVSERIARPRETCGYRREPLAPRKGLANMGARIAHPEGNLRTWARASRALKESCEMWARASRALGRLAKHRCNPSAPEKTLAKEKTHL